MHAIPLSDFLFGTNCSVQNDSEVRYKSKIHLALPLCGAGQRASGTPLKRALAQPVETQALSRTAISSADLIMAETWPRWTRGSLACQKKKKKFALQKVMNYILHILLLLRADALKSEYLPVVSKRQRLPDIH